MKSNKTQLAAKLLVTGMTIFAVQASFAAATAKFSGKEMQDRTASMRPALKAELTKKGGDYKTNLLLELTALAKSAKNISSETMKDQAVFDALESFAAANRVISQDIRNGVGDKAELTATQKAMKGSIVLLSSKEFVAEIKDADIKGAILKQIELATKSTLFENSQRDAYADISIKFAENIEMNGMKAEQAYLKAVMASRNISEKEARELIKKIKDCV